MRVKKVWELKVDPLEVYQYIREKYVRWEQAKEAGDKKLPAKGTTKNELMVHFHLDSHAIHDVVVVLEAAYKIYYAAVKGSAGRNAYPVLLPYMGSTGKPRKKYPSDVAGKSQRRRQSKEVITQGSPMPKVNIRRDDG